MASTKKTSSAKSKPSRVQVRDLKAKKDAKGGAMGKMSPQGGMLDRSSKFSLSAASKLSIHK
jgi:hypothetical protein